MTAEDVVQPRALEDDGWLVEVNRLFFHPRGASLHPVFAPGDTLDYAEVLAALRGAYQSGADDAQRRTLAGLIRHFETGGWLAKLLDSGPIEFDPAELPQAAALAARCRPATEPPQELPCVNRND